ncbi:MAG TPA: ATP synthase F0 subunit B [Thermodesulfobacteriota bacterium]|jgi:F-type H+-transporting ATPase subunit b
MNKLIQPIYLLFVFTVLVFSTTNAKAAEELLSIDKTLIIQMVIFISAIFILNSLLFKPLLQLVERREQLTTGRIKEAKELEKKVEQIIKEYKEKLDEVRAKAMEERNEIRRVAQTAGDKLIAKAHDEAQVLIQEAKAKLWLEASEIREKIKPEIEILARDMASQILGREL